MFDTLKKLIPRDRQLPERAWRLDVLGRVLDGTIYDVLQHDFHEERTDGGEYIPIRKRRPSVRYALCATVVSDSVALLFGDGRFPAIDGGAPETNAAIAGAIHEMGIPGLMLDAAYRGSIGSVAVLVRVLGGRIFPLVMDTALLTPAWQPEAPDTLLSVTEQYKVRGDVLAGLGYAIPADQLAASFWFRRVWDDQAETWFLPWPAAETDRVPTIDAERTKTHKLGFVPIVWMRNLPGGDGIDGACTFERAIPTQVEIDYQLSQAGRGLKYSSDPLLLIREPAAGDNEIIRGAGNALVVSEKGDAKMLEIGGTAAAAVIEYTRALRELALESVHGNRSNADKVSAAQSGRAMELMHQPLIWLADKLRISYGDNGLLEIARMIARISRTMPINLRDGSRLVIPDVPLALRWGSSWFHPTQADQQATAGALATLRDGGMMSRETAVKVIAPVYDIADPKAEVAAIEAETSDADARAAAMAAQVKATETIPA